MKKVIHYPNEWVMEEASFDSRYIQKFESTMAQGNGYLEARNTLEERYKKSKPGLFVSGMFNQFSSHEVTELVNFPDVFLTEISLNKELVNLESGKILSYSRQMNFKNGESVRSVVWKSAQGIELKLMFKRFVSMHDKHVIVQQVRIDSCESGELEILSGIDAQITNSGSQHFEEGEKRYFDKKYLQLFTQTTQTHLPVSVTCGQTMNHSFDRKAIMKRRQIFEKFSGTIQANEPIIFEKYISIYTGRDQEFDSKKEEWYLRKQPLLEVQKNVDMGYERLMAASEDSWNQIWQKAPIEIKTPAIKDKLLLNFARYHIHAMAPVQDNRMNIGAKGMTGEGYKGHTFWDTEIFLLPYFSYNYPESAKHLIEFRLNSLQAAEQNAKSNGYDGAQYPWEAAWLTDGEVTPEFGEIDIVTGEPTPILTGKLEHHVTGDVVFGASQYITISQDSEFEEMIFPMVWSCAKFWCTRVEWNDHKNRYDILDVIGPDEYKEHVNNNAYTNYLAKYTIDRSIALYAKYKESLSEEEQGWLEKMQQVSQALYLPVPDEQSILPQDDDYLTKKIIDLAPYHQAKQVGTIFHDYNLEEVNKIQVSKQADVLLLMLLFSNQFTKQELMNNWDYYYPKTLHDSSLSMCVHCNYALLLDKTVLAYELFKKTFEIDLGDTNMFSSDEGIHSASMGGIWQNVVLGFGGLAITTKGISISPKLPKEWEELSYTFSYGGKKIKVHVFSEQIVLEKNEDSEIPLFVNGKKVILKENVTIAY